MFSPLLSIPINLDTEISQLNPFLAQKVIDTATNTNRLTLIFIGIINIISFGIGLSFLATSPKYHADKKERKIMAMVLIPLGLICGAIAYNNYRHYNLIHLPQLQKLANQG